MITFWKLWVWRMAYRDSRRGFFRLLLSMSCVILAVALVVLAFSFRENLLASIRSQSKSLLGADLALDSREPFSKDDEKLIHSLGGDQSRQVGFTSMVTFSANGESRLVQVRAIGGRFPYYGALETTPALSLESFHSGANALVDENVLLQFNAKVGDGIKLGDQEFRILGSLRKIPGESLAFSLISPRIYIPLDFLDRTKLIQKGSVVRYRVFFKFAEGTQVDRIVKEIAPQLPRLQLDADTVSRRTESIAANMENLSRFLRLAVFVAVLLAGIGVASVTYVYAKEKAQAAALLRCIGARPRDTVSVYLLQLLFLTIFCSAAGAGLGVWAQSYLPEVLKDFLPVVPVIEISPMGIAAGVVTGMTTAFLFALLPLISLRRISPLMALRASYDEEARGKDPLVIVIVLLIGLLVLAFASATLGSWRQGAMFAGAVLLVFVLLAMLARVGALVMRRVAPRFLTFSWRQGLANLHRPSNQTSAVMLAIGLGTFLLVALHGAQDTLLRQVDRRIGQNEPNLVLFDVQNEQRKGIGELFSRFKIPRHAEVPIVTMRLAAVKGRRVEEIRADVSAKIPGWALRREYRSTYRGALSGTEKLVKGDWIAKADERAQPIPVSVEKGIAETLGVDVGDALQFEIQGVPINTLIANLREVDWQRVQPNFFVVFPEGVLEKAPQFFAVVGRAPSSQASAQMQRAVLERFPNVSAIDLSLILSTLNSILDRVAGAMRFVAWFTLLTGFTVLASAVLGSRGYRVRESILLRTLGAARGQILSSIVAEYVFTGAIASIAGAILGILASLGLSYYFFGTAITIAPLPVLTIILAVTG
ncbi:MAG TPA: FtsX-like permease family protein, partial [Candidatus Binatia bacterium]|nr:FtsX-like permease family protein [Candidatus Binatia bacterium]